MKRLLNLFLLVLFLVLSCTQPANVGVGGGGNSGDSGISIDFGIKSFVVQSDSGINIPVTKNDRDYNGTVENAESIKVKIVPKDSSLVIRVNGNVVNSDTFSQLISINNGENLIVVTLATTDLSYSYFYRLKINKLTTVSSDKTLSNIQLKNSSGQAISFAPSFSKDVLEYTATVENSVSSCKIVALKGFLKQTLKINGANYEAGTEKEISLNVGNNEVSIEVTAENNEKQIYKVTINRAQSGVSNNANLSALALSNGSLSPVFNKDELNYTVSVGNSISSIKVTPTVEQSNATVKVNGVAVASGSQSGDITLNVGDNTITVEVTAQDGVSKRTYTVIVNRAQSNVSNNANLSSLTVSTGTLNPAFNSNILNYSMTVQSSVSSIKVTPTVEQSNATVKVNGVAVTSGSQSGDILLAEGSNTVTIEVTAQDNTTKKTYTINVTREPSSSTIKIYFKKVNQASTWTSVKIHYWGLDSTPSSSNWPGVDMSRVGTTDWYVYEFNSSKVNLVINSGSGSKTVDITNITKTTYFIPNGTSNGNLTCSSSEQNPDGPIPPSVSATPGTTSFTTANLQITLNLSGESIVVSKYTLDGSDPKTSGTAVTFTNGTIITIGSGMNVGDTKTLKLYAKNNSNAEDSKTYQYTKADVNAGLTVHFKRPAGWTKTPKIHYWDVVPTMPQTQWPGVAMTDEGNGWFTYTIPGATSAKIVFNNDSYPQTGNLTRNKEGWYKDGVWTDGNPEGPQKVVVVPSVQPGTYLTAQTVSLSSNNPTGDIIYYTTNGTEPTSSSTQYSTPISVTSGTVTIKAKGYNAGANPQWGDTYTFTYTVDPNADLVAPTVEVKSGDPLPGRWATAPGNVSFTIKDNKTATTKAYYTTDGTDPTTSSPIYVQGNCSGSGLTGSPINVNQTMAIKFLVVDGAGNQTRQDFYYKIGLSNDFREETIYFVITTRFYDGAPENNVHCWDDAQAGNPDTDPAWRGDFEGLKEKLDYIKALGFSAIWVTPPVKNASGYDYHGYHAINFKEIDPRYRTATKTAEQSYKDFIAAAHAKGMKVIQDIVFNHTSNFGEENLYPLFRRNAPALNSVNESITAALTKIAPPGKLPSNYDSLPPGQQYSARINAMKEDSIDTEHIYHHEKSLSWEGYTVQTGQIAGDCVDLNTENPVVSQYLREAYLQYISWGVDAYRVDTVKHISRLTFNREFIPQLTQAGGQYFYIFGETCTRYRSVWNSEIPAISVPFYTWKEEHPNYGGINYPWSTRQERESSVALHWTHNAQVNNEPTSNNHYLNGNNYRPVDYTYRNRFDQIDFPMHWSFNSVGDAFNMALGGDQYYSDATWNVVYVDSHDYAPDGAPENKRYCGSWEEKLTLIFTFRGIPCIYYGTEIEFKKGMPIDVGPNAKLEDTGRAYFGNHITGTNPTVSDFGVWTGGSGNIVTTLNHPLAKHIQRLNQIRRKLPALQKGQYSVDNINSNGAIAFKRRYTDATVDNFVLVSINGSATFNSIPNGTYREVITGATVNVTNGTLTASSCNGNGNARIYVLLGTTGMTDPGKIGQDGAYLKP